MRYTNRGARTMDQNNHIDQEVRLLGHIRFCQQVFSSNADWEYKYERIFKLWRNSINPLLRSMGLELEWCDVSDSYENEVTAFMTALTEKLLPNVLAVVDGEVITGEGNV